MPEVFISYARANEALAKRLGNALEKEGFDVWWDAQLPAHRAYGDIIQQKLGAADAVVVLWSKDAAQSEWVRAEADFARSNRKLVQAQTDDILPPLPFNQIQCADLRGWRGHRTHKGWLKLKESIASVASGEGHRQAEPSAVRGSGGWRIDKRIAAAATAVLVLVAAAFLFLPGALKAEGPPTVAVLPFASLAATDQNLVDGIWEDTRQALSRNPQITVIGRNSAEAMARDDLDPRQYRSRYGVDYVIGGTIRSAGGKLRFSVDLVRTKDGAQVWSESFDRQIKDVFDLQAEIAEEIEGRVRGRLAEGGGRVAEHISTSPEVYALYNDARAIIHKRDVANMPQATRLLKRAIQIDPNYAPAYATLALAQYYSIPAARDATQDFQRSLQEYARRATALAPNLAIGYAALGMVLPAGPEAEGAIRHAIALDPNDADSIAALANVELDKDNLEKGLALYNQAAVIEPLSNEVILNRLQLLIYLKRNAEIDRELERLGKSGAVALNGLARMTVLEDRNDLSEAARAGLTAYKASSAEERGLLGVNLAATLIDLQLNDVAARVTPVPAWTPYLWNNDPRGLPFVDKLPMSKQDFWGAAPLTELVCRSLAVHGRYAQLVKLYREGAGSPEVLAERAAAPPTFAYVAPLIAIALRKTGDPKEGEAMLSMAEQQVQGAVAESRRHPNTLVRLARIRAVQGRTREGAGLVLEAVRGGWVATPPVVVPELLQDPALALLKDEPAFRQARASILAFVARERKELGPVNVEEVPMAPRPPGPPTAS